MKKIMIVDDAKFMQKVTSDMLKASYETVCVSSGEEALARFEQEKPDMILTDLVMPKMSGLELQRLLHERYSRHIPVMFMTADEREDSESRSFAGGAADYIRKPFNREVLLRRIGNIMQNLERIAELKTDAETDPMTGLLNKSHAQKVLGEVCTKAAGVLMMVDLDSFKLVNDLYGHGMGDKILIRFADILRATIRGSDVAGRMGGDEFIVFCRDVREEQIIAEKSRAINDALLASAREYMGADMTIPLGASIGAVHVPEEGTEFAALYRKADKALYRVKQHGKHGYAFYQSESAPGEKEDAAGAPGSIRSARVILEERNRKKGAYEVDFEQFRSIYRFLIRAIEGSRKSVELVSLTLTDPTLTDEFGESLRSSLRRSDVYTRSGATQYLVLLSDMQGADARTIERRVLDNWSAAGRGESGDVIWDSVLISAEG